MANAIPETARRILTPGFLRSAAKQSERCLVVPVRLRRAIKKYLREQADSHVKRKVFRLSESFRGIKERNLMLTETTSREVVEDPFKFQGGAQRWKIKSAYGDIGLKYAHDETLAYVASRMPAVYSACYRVLSEVWRRLPDFAPKKVLDFGAGPGTAFWAMREVWPKCIEKMDVVEPSQSMQRAGQSLIQDLKGLPLIRSYGSIEVLSKDINRCSPKTTKDAKRSERDHDLVIASYVLGEVPSLKDRITMVRQLWELTSDVLVLIEPGTPHGSKIISQMRSHILWLEKRRCRKAERKKTEACKELVPVNNGAFIVAPCAHDGRCPLVSSGRYCHFAQRLQRTSSQRAYKRFAGEPLRGYEDEKYSYVAFRRGQRPLEPWPLDDVEFDTLKEQRAKRNPSEEFDIDYEDQNEESEDEDDLSEVEPISYESDMVETDTIDNDEDDEERDEQKETAGADLGGGWGRILHMPSRSGRRVTLDVCRSVNREGTEGAIERIVVTRSQNPTLHRQAKKSYWGDLWPF